MSDMLLHGMTPLRPGNLLSQSVLRGIGQRYGHGLGGLGSLLDELDSQTSVASAHDPETATRRLAARERAADLVARYGASAAEVGGIIQETSGLVAAISTASNKMEVARAALRAIAAVAELVQPGIGSLMSAAVEGLWALVLPGLHALSAALRTPGVGESMRNAFLHRLGYSTGACSSHGEEQGGLARAYGDSWYIVGGVTYNNQPWGARAMLENWYNMGMGPTPSDTGIMARVVEGTVPLLRTGANAVDGMVQSGDVAGARTAWAKIVPLADKVFPRGRERFEAITGIRSSWAIDRGAFVDFGTTNPTNADEAKDPRRALWGEGRVTVCAGGPFDLVAFKLSRFPADIKQAVVAGLFADASEWPDDFFVRYLLNFMKGERYYPSQGGVLAAKALEQWARPAGSGDSGKRRDGGAPPSASKPWTTGEKVAVGGVAVGAGALVTKLLGWW